MTLYAEVQQARQSVNDIVELMRAIGDVRAIMPDGPDSAFADLLAEPRAALRPPREGTAMSAYRARLDAPMAAVAGPALFRVDDLDGAATGVGVAIRRYWPSAAAETDILFIHGGGFVIGSLDTHDALCRSLARASGARVTAVDYRLAPEARFPAGRDDCLAAVRWLHEQGGAPFAVCGDSAGGHLALSVAIDAAREHIAIASLALLYPVVDPRCATESWDMLGEGHILTREWMRWAWGAYAGTEQIDLCLFDADLALLPPTLIVTAQFDPLCDEGEALGVEIGRARVPVWVRRMSGMIHGFASLPMLTDCAGLTIGLLASHISQHGR